MVTVSGRTIKADDATKYAGSLGDPLEFGINLQNLTMHENVFIQKYNKQTGIVAVQYQQDFLPVPYFRLTF